MHAMGFFIMTLSVYVRNIWLPEVPSDLYGLMFEIILYKVTYSKW